MVGIGKVGIGKICGRGELEDEIAQMRVPSIR